MGCVRENRKRRMNRRFPFAAEGHSKLGANADVA